MKKKYYKIGNKKVIFVFEEKDNFPCQALVYNKELEKFEIDNSFVMDYLEGDETKQMSHKDFFKQLN
jgi:hypothetical protein